MRYGFGARSVGAERVEEVRRQPSRRGHGCLGGAGDDPAVGHQHQCEVVDREVRAEVSAQLGSPRQLGEATQGAVAYLLDVDRAGERTGTSRS
jgi:hypothetical protein